GSPPGPGHGGGGHGADDPVFRRAARPALAAGPRVADRAGRPVARGDGSGRARRTAPCAGAAAAGVHRPGFPLVARQVAQLIVAALLAAAAPFALAQPELRTPQTPWTSLSPEQRRILGPVAPDWDRMPGYQQQRLMSA